MPIHNSEETGFIFLSSNLIDIYTVYKQILKTTLNTQISLLKCILIGDKWIQETYLDFIFNPQTVHKLIIWSTIWVSRKKNDFSKVQDLIENIPLRNLGNPICQWHEPKQSIR